jgi:hypothetical protein
LRATIRPGGFGNISADGAVDQHRLPGSRGRRALDLPGSGCRDSVGPRLYAVGQYGMSGITARHAIDDQR